MTYTYKQEFNLFDLDHLKNIPQHMLSSLNFFMRSQHQTPCSYSYEPVVPSNAIVGGAWENIRTSVLLIKGTISELITMGHILAFSNISVSLKYEKYAATRYLEKRHGSHQFRYTQPILLNPILKVMMHELRAIG